MEVETIEGFRARFNDGSGAVRVVSLLSPTCLVCQYGAGVVKTIIGSAGEDDLRGLIAWIPMMDSDDLRAARREAGEMQHDRIGHVWDGDRRLGTAFAGTLGLEGHAWDVYLLYGAGAVWTAESPPEPDFWMHQLPTSVRADPARLLRPGRFAQEARSLLGKGSEPLDADIPLILHAVGLSAIRTDRKQPSLEEVAAVSMSK